MKEIIEKIDIDILETSSIINTLQNDIDIQTAQEEYAEKTIAIIEKQNANIDYLNLLQEMRDKLFNLI